MSLPPPLTRTATTAMTRIQLTRRDMNLLSGLNSDEARSKEEERLIQYLHVDLNLASVYYRSSARVQKSVSES